jgi:hypothetical protein
VGWREVGGVARDEALWRGVEGRGAGAKAEGGRGRWEGDGGGTSISPTGAPSSIGGSSVRRRFADGSADAPDRAGGGGRLEMRVSCSTTVSARPSDQAAGSVGGVGAGDATGGATGAHPPEMVSLGGRAVRSPPLPPARRAGAAATISRSRDSISASSRPWGRAVMAGSHPLSSARAAASESAAAETARRLGSPMPNSEKT